jgi:ferredoxin
MIETPMPKLTIDQRDVEVPPGTTVLAAARQLGIEIPTLCFLEGCEPSTSCLVCVVKINGNARLSPACATLAEDGMRVECETKEVRAARRTALELLLSDHLGDCLAPCWFGCPARMDIPKMLRQIAMGNLRGAIATVKRDIALPAVLGRICPAPCEKVCRRRGLDGAVAICLLKRYVADVDLVSGNPYLPDCQSSTGKRVAIVGGGPTGLSTAYYLTQAGHACTIFDSSDRLGGHLWTSTSPDQLPRDVLQAEIGQITRLGMEIRLNERREESDGLFRHFNAVLLACGHQAASGGHGPGVDYRSRHYVTDRPGVFAAGGAGLVVRNVADGKEAALAIGQFLRGLPVTGPEKPFNTKIGRMDGDELREFAAGASQESHKDPGQGLVQGYNAEEAVGQAARCLHCDCRGLDDCKLRRCAALYGADPKRFAVERRRFQQDLHHADVVFEPGKCIDCGLCIQIAAAEGEKIGLTFTGRGFNVRLSVPLNRDFHDALTQAAAQCVAACPTAALAWK